MGSITFVQKFGLHKIKLKHFFVGVPVFYFLYLSIVFFHSHYAISINLSESLPYKFFIMKKTKEFNKGDIVWVEYQPRVHNVLKYDFGVPMGKYVGGVPGDKVTLIGNKFLVNGKFLCKAKEFSISHIKLVKNKPKILGDDEYFLYTPHPDGFDSRYVYMGYVHKNQIIGKSLLEF